MRRPDGAEDHGPEHPEHGAADGEAGTPAGDPGAVGPPVGDAPEEGSVTDDSSEDVPRTDQGREGGSAPAAAPESAARRRRARIALAATALVAVVVAIVLAVGSFDDPTEGASRTTVAGVELAGGKEARELLQGIPQDGTLLGDPAAPVTIHEFADLKCPACQSYEIRQQPETIATLVRTGRANLRIHFINVIDPGQRTTDGAGLINAAYGLAAKDRLWAFVHVLYFNQGPENREWATEPRLRAIAAGSPGVDPADVSIRETPAARAMAFRDRRLAKRLGVRATPTVYVQPRGVERFGLVEDPYGGLAAAVEAATPQTAPRSAAR